MPFGGMPQFTPPQLTRPPGQGVQLDNRPATTWQEYGRAWKNEEPGDSRTDAYRDTVNGVLVGYTGFVPNRRTHVGTAHDGGLARVGSRGRLAQRGHGGAVERLQGDKECMTNKRTERTAKPMPGYQGHVPQAIDSFGTSHWGSREPDARQAQAQLYHHASDVRRANAAHARRNAHHDARAHLYTA
uniref:Ciliary microtubule inner protein 2A-C-like domain-containing protein n=1 Tax=Haptolina brevifila TaxID=156173 RepID=A0A7S2HEH4_9EUKA|mmetsp:Transcript_53888/g.107122  ORF Transcript_53888/g.107122 Transcript_53888/m.107122 type:complete len:186 (+) Transcript_53888:2-559(+)